MLAIVGTVPDQTFPLVAGQVTLEDSSIFVRGASAPVTRGTPALLAAAVRTAVLLGRPAPYAYLVGDIGPGHGSRSLYEHLAGHLQEADFETLVFHYLQPDVDWHNRVLFAVEEMPRRPKLIADAGFMYAAKMSGQSGAYDLFTPDVGELAFLADETAPHPFYTRGFILHEENRVPELISRAYAHANAARYLLVKGSQDYLADRKGIQQIISDPVEEALEAIGGTGDTLTGMAAALIDAGMEVGEAAATAARLNRLAGYHARPTPATRVLEIIAQIPRALGDVLRMGKGRCYGYTKAGSKGRSRSGC
jgi:NAD(P)H-hydrate repair Nnr-like enzyme with NAD(P)H-hydrate dehydratase domain